ncbi:MAG TPA: UDP-N-acetylmuramoyl-L-alanine--D-glutamate ligase [Candidatus Intestinimonas pullistercoris]|uniref:UDP-N-acetylmuramoylalanine--D-glutamate ligase n=1 Tax=Candidatus Intestinimonas pullistercoris TaxID=2838623 RepID=A0A9D2T124_9FIRM|nr:UDP-N-acetylmuramoyl-L-alanine--D-glutamate ligase [uncultured Intestinimonas sp.]HJC41669.1 UDP-N-acetylmuramoyl-L-alanine--D-glutamate ligase [Candidatus Intestinimonas pullistercoris]
MAATIQEYLAGLRGKTVAVIGIGVSNTPLIKMLLRSGIRVTACDKKRREEFGGLAEELESLGAELRLGPDYLRGLDQDVIFRTPGLRPDVSELLLAQAKGSVVTSEMEVFFQVCPCHTIAVTGSDGKTTTTTIIAELLKKAGYHTFVGGNIGKPLLPDVDGMVPEDYAVLELSSFQLMTMDQSPEIAVVTNLAPNHLDVHKSMAEYIAAKENIFTHQGPEGKAVFNYDNAITREFSESAPGQAVLFSRRQELTQGVYVKDGAIWVSNREGSRAVLPLADILLPGEHNVENYMAAIAAVDGLVPDEVIRAFAAQFAGVEHRIELVRTLDGVRYYNDSIASSPSRTIAGLRSFREKVILIAGGYDKHIPFDALGPEVVEHVKYLVLTGDTADKIAEAVRTCPDYHGTPPISKYEDFDAAVMAAHSMAQPGDVVLLSPACASFDHFKNFAQRGEAFKKIIYEL